MECVAVEAVDFKFPFTGKTYKKGEEFGYEIVYVVWVFFYFLTLFLQLFLQLFLSGDAFFLSSSPPPPLSFSPPLSPSLFFSCVCVRVCVA